MNSHNIWIGGGAEDKKKCCLAKVSFAEKMYKQIATSCTLLPLQNKFNLLKIKNINYCYTNAKKFLTLEKIVHLLFVTGKMCMLLWVPETSIENSKKCLRYWKLTGYLQCERVLHQLWYLYCKMKLILPYYYHCCRFTCSERQKTIISFTEDPGHKWCIAQFAISHYLVFVWSFEHMQMHANTFFYLPVLSTRLHELVWHANGSIKCQTFECHANGQCNDVRMLLPDFKVSWDCNTMSSFNVIRHVPSKIFTCSAAQFFH